MLLVCMFYHFRPQTNELLLDPVAVRTSPQHTPVMFYRVLFIYSPQTHPTYLHLLSYLTAKRLTYPYCTSLGRVLPSHPLRLSSLPALSDRWAGLSAAATVLRGKDPLARLSVRLPKAAPMANKNTARGTQMATRTVCCYCSVKRFPRNWDRTPWMTLKERDTRFRVGRCAEARR